MRIASDTGLFTADMGIESARYHACSVKIRWSLGRRDISPRDISSEGHLIRFLSVASQGRKAFYLQTVA